MAQEYGLINAGNQQVVVLATFEPLTADKLFRLSVLADCTWQIEFRGQQLNVETSNVLPDLPVKMNALSLEKLVRLIVSGSVCVGHSDLPRLPDQCEKTGTLVSHDQSTVVAYHSNGTIRHADCSVMMAQPSRNRLCAACGQSDFRTNLRSREKYLSSKRISVNENCPGSKFTPNIHLNDDEKNAKLKHMS